MIIYQTARRSKMYVQKHADRRDKMTEQLDASQLHG